jgi:hypothetical protein
LITVEAIEEKINNAIKSDYFDYGMISILAFVGLMQIGIL